MATLFGTAAQSTSRVLVSEGASRGMDVSRDGTLFTLDWLMRMVMAGLVYGVNVGTGTGPTTFNATYAAAEPDLYIYVPTDTAIIPVYMSVQLEDTGTAAVMDVMACATSTGDSAVTGTALTKYNLKTNAPFTSNCTATAVVTAAGTSPLAGNFIEFWRPYAGFAEDAFNGSTAFINSKVHGSEWSILKVGVAPIIMETGALALYVGATAGIGFITCLWIELPVSAVK